MGQADTLVMLYGTDEPTQSLRQVSLGPLSFLYSQNGLRRISWHGTELVRALAWPIRDESWGTYQAELLAEDIDESDGFRAHVTFAVGQARLICDLRLRATADGAVLADLTMTPKGGSFATNRAGFTVLHPIKGFAGQALDVTHSDGTQAATVFPKLIQPDQPVKDIAGLRYGLGSQSVDITFDGEVFEMEDQRNWSDASYKTYCVPLVHPFVYDINEPLRQSIRMNFENAASPAKASTGHNAVHVQTLDARAPDIGLALETGCIPKSPIPAIDVSHVLLRTSPQDRDLSNLAAFAKAYPVVDLEIVLPNDAPVEVGLRKVAKAFASQGISPARVIAIREVYLASHQPTGPWPKGPTPNDMLETVRSVFPKADIGSGMLTNFTEMNRYPPDSSQCDYVTHGLTPLVHAGDDLSILETLEALPQIFASAQVLADGRPYRLGLASIGMRSNPYGADVAANPAQIRQTMARIDPRHRGLFGAAFATGVLAATEGSAIEALCLGTPVGPFGLMYEPTKYPQAGYDQTARQVYPLFHVVRAACAMAGFPRVSLHGLPDGISGYGAQVDGRNRIILANVSDQLRAVTLADPAKIIRLDTDSFNAATCLADWLDTAVPTQEADLKLPPFSVAFLG